MCLTFLRSAKYFPKPVPFTLYWPSLRVMVKSLTTLASLFKLFGILVSVRKDLIVVLIASLMSNGIEQFPLHTAIRVSS